MTEPDERDHYVYRLLDAAGTLLYVGVTSNPARRRTQHAHTQPWWSDVASWRLFGPLPRDEAYTLEVTAIATESPLHNKARPGVAPEARSPVAGPYVGPQEIAAALGVGRQRVYQLVSRRDFPAPVAELAMGNVWRRADVIKWAADKGRAVEK